MQGFLNRNRNKKPPQAHLNPCRLLVSVFGNIIHMHSYYIFISFGKVYLDTCIRLVPRHIFCCSKKGIYCEIQDPPPLHLTMRDLDMDENCKYWCNIYLKILFSTPEYPANKLSIGTNRSNQ